MSEEIINNEADNAEIEKIEKIKIALNKLDDKKSKFLVCIPESVNPSATVTELYFHATALKEMGYNVIVLVESNEYKIPNWVDSHLTKFIHSPMNNNKLSVGPEDVMIIPEIFSNVMEQTKNLPCLKIGLLQSVDYMLNGLVPGTDWKSFGINEVITTSLTSKEFIETFYGKDKFNVQIYNPAIPDYFKRTEVPQKPIISVVGRNSNEVAKIVKLFYSRYPQYAWVSFDPLLSKSKPPKPLRRVDYAERLRGNFAAVWVDRISTWGTFPLECMKSGVLPIALIPDITPEYLLERDENGEAIKMKDNSGIWTNNFYDIPVLIGETLIKFMDDSIGDKIYENMEKIASEFTTENATKQLVEVYSNIIENRKSVFKEAIDPVEDKK